MGPTHCIIEGEIYEIGESGILQHGFVWSESPDVNLDSGNKNELGTAGPGVPVLLTWSAFNVGSYKAQSGGNISSDGGSEVTARGEILHEPYQVKNGFSVRCILDH